MEEIVQTFSMVYDDDILLPVITIFRYQSLSFYVGFLSSLLLLAILLTTTLGRMG